jgi:hypothetical protein
MSPAYDAAYTAAFYAFRAGRDDETAYAEACAAALVASKKPNYTGNYAGPGAYGDAYAATVAAREAVAR